MKANSRRQSYKTKDEKIRKQARTIALQAHKMLKEREKLQEQTMAAHPKPKPKKKKKKKKG